MDIIESTSLLGGWFPDKKLLMHQRKEVDKLNSFIESKTGSEIPDQVLTRIRWGKKVKTLINESIKGGYEFIIIDKSHDDYRGSFSKNEIDRIVSKSHCPVLAINKDRLIEKINNIIIPIDITRATKKKLYWATFFANRFNAKIQIVCALNINIDESKSLAYKNAEKLKSMLHDRGVRCDVKILKAPQRQKYKVILEYIEEEKPELVIIRTHQEYGFSGKKIGKFVSEIVHSTPIPVFTVGGKTHNLLEKTK